MKGSQYDAVLLFKERIIVMFCIYGVYGDISITRSIYCKEAGNGLPDEFETVFSFFLWTCIEAFTGLHLAVCVFALSGNLLPKQFFSSLV